MKLLANENFPGGAVKALRARGHDVVWIREDSPGISDPEVLARALREDRILLTFDKDFGELAFRARRPITSGIVLFRIRKPSASYIASIVVQLIDSAGPWAGLFSVVEDTRIRRRPLPAH
jgi:predicted nuclease of predicted toxin-antitoxin system